MERNIQATFNDKTFLESPEGRSVRILSEYERIKSAIEQHKIMETITFFGSARSMPKDNKNNNISDVDLENSEYYEQARALSFKFTKWAEEFSKEHNRFAIATGGGPGIMEAANRGAIEANGKSIGFGIKLPVEQKNNDYISPELSFQFHYFFMRKFFLTFLAKATIIFPGGFGTLDELSEVLTLKQTGRILAPMPIVLIGKKYWNSAINFNYLFEKKMIDKEDLNLFLITDYIDQAFIFVSCILKEKCLDNPAIHNI
jgi:uncharacterized protein (TIGR00730 family)